MKKLNKTFLSLVLLLMLAFPVLLTGCDFNKDSLKTYSIYLSISDINHGSVYGSGNYAENEKVYIYAVAKEGYVFDKWDDNNTENPREILITENKVYTANFVTKSTGDSPAETKYYALDKVELYCNANGTLTANNVGLNRIIINDSESNLVASCLPLYAGSSSNGWGAQLIEYLPSLNRCEIIASSDTPFTFYSARTEANKFEFDKAVSLKVTLNIDCFSWYIDGENIVQPSGGYNHGGNVVSNKAISTTSLTDSSLTQTVTLYSCATHGYSIMLRMNFVEI